MVDHGDRNSFRLSAARIRGIHFRFDQGQSMVVDAVDARGLYFLGHGFGDCTGNAAVHADYLGKAAGDRHEVCRYCGALPLLYLCDRFQPGDAGPDSPHLRGG